MFLPIAVYRPLQYIFLFFYLFLSWTNCYGQYTRYADTSKVSFSLFAKAGIVYDYPFYANYSDIGPMGEVGTNIIFDKFQIGLGFGYFPNNSYWNQGADNSNPAKRGITKTGCFYFPLNANFKLFNFKGNFLSLKLGFIFLTSTNAQITETLIPTNVTSNFEYSIPKFGMAGTMGFKYSRLIGKNIFVGAELGMNFALVPTLLLGTDYTYGYNMISRHPNGDFKICFEYIFGKKHSNYLNETNIKTKNKKERVEDEE